MRAEEDHEAASHAHEHPLLDDFAQLLPAGLEPAPGREHAPERRRLAVGGPVIFFPARDGMAAPRREISQERLEPHRGELGVSENAPQYLRVEDRAGVVGHGDAGPPRRHTATSRDVRATLSG